MLTKINRFGLIVVDQTLRIIMVLERVHEFVTVGYIMDSYHFYGFRSDSGLRNTCGIEKAYYFDLQLL